MAELDEVANRIAETVPQLKEGTDYTSLRIEPGSSIVTDGIFMASKDKNMTYAAVPLSLIRKGDISIIVDGKATKRLLPEELFGVFETAYYLKFSRNRRIGRWSLKTNTEAEVLTLTKHFWDHADADLRDALIQGAVQNHAPKPLSRLPVLDEFAANHPMEIRDDTALIYHSHLLESSYDLIKHLASLFGYQTVFVLEKPYSTMDSVANKIVQIGVNTHFVKIDGNMPYDFSIKRSVEYVWSKVVHHVRQHNLKHIAIVSDGGDFLTTVPWGQLEEVTFVGVEQTQRGLNRVQNLGEVTPPVINVAASYAKKTFESPMIGKSIFEKIKSLGLLETGGQFGVIGNGDVGQAIIKELDNESTGYVVYDNQPDKVAGERSVDSLEELVDTADTIIGTTGTDVLRGMYVERLSGHKTLISASSSNLEFNYVFDLAKTYANKFEDVHLKINDNLEFTVLNGGYPINFDRKQKWVPLEDIQLTRTLLYAGVLQALESEMKPGEIAELDRDYQDEIVELWKQAASLKQME